MRGSFALVQRAPHVAKTHRPAPGFYAAGDAAGGGRSRTVHASPSLFSLDLAFGRRLVFASLLTLAVLGSYLVSRETD